MMGLKEIVSANEDPEKYQQGRLTDGQKKGHVKKSDREYARRINTELRTYDAHLKED